MHASDPKTVASDANVGGEAFVASLSQFLDRSARRLGPLTLIIFDEVVDRHHVDMIDAHPFERLFELVASPSTSTRPSTGLGREEYISSMIGKPRLEPVFRLAIRRPRQCR
ncbi:MAG: hypothetical protein ACJAR2_001355 [Ilumatobacter sp.]|jgi:hypothetical protein